MGPVIDLHKIAKSAEEDWNDNWNFRAFLHSKIARDQLDQLAHSITAIFTSEIDCTRCGNCCREVYPHMTTFDIDRLRKGLSDQQVNILQNTKQQGEFTTFCHSPCPLLKENKCTAYEVRPSDCREYPHLDKPDFFAGSVGFIENYGTCPIVYNVWNRLKASLSYDSSIDYIGDSDPEALV